MIDLSYTRAQLLAELEATNPSGEPLNDITDPRVATANTHAGVYGHGRDDLFSLRKIALLERFAAVARPQMIRDLLMPLRNALGNAYKHGNLCDSTKTVSVDTVLTRKAVLIAITDEGTGFDVALTFRRFQDNEAYFLDHGTGFRNLHGAMSTVTYENSGRSALLCFRPSDGSEDASFSRPVSAGDPTMAPEESPAGCHVLPKILDPVWIHSCLLAEVPEFDNGRTRLDSCRVYETSGRPGDDCGNRYLLSPRGGTSHEGSRRSTACCPGRSLMGAGQGWRE